MPKPEFQFDRRSSRLPLSLSVFLLGLTACGGETEAAPKAEPRTDPRPNIIVLLVDTLRQDHLGTYGYEVPTSPNIDRMAEEGLVFEDTWSQASQTFPSMASLLTSRAFPYVVENRIYEPVPGMKKSKQERFAGVPYIAEENVTLAEVLADEGYETIGIFTNPHLHPTSGFWQGLEHAQFLTGDDHAYARGNKIRDSFEEWLTTRDTQRPFYAHLHFMDVHNPYDPPAHTRRKFVKTKGRDVYMSGKPEGDGVPTENDLQYMQELYDAEINYFDEIMEEIREYVAVHCEFENTIWVLAADHGDEFMDHGGLGHGRTVYPEMLRVPLIIAGVPGVEPGRIPGLISNLDIAPTIVHLAGGQPPSSFEGSSLFRDGGGFGTTRTHSLAQIKNLRSMTTAEWHMIRDTQDGNSQQLFDRVRDPATQTDLYGARQADVSPLHEGLNEYEKRRDEAKEFSTELSKVQGGNKDVDPKYLEQLRALGYLGEDAQD